MKSTVCSARRSGEQGAEALAIVPAARSANAGGPLSGREVHRDAGETLRAEDWLKVLANVLSSAPEGPVGKRNGPNAPEHFGLSYVSLLVAAERCGLEVTADMVERQVAATKAWREKESARIGRQHYVATRLDTIGRPARHHRRSPARGEGVESRNLRRLA